METRRGKVSPPEPGWLILTDANGQCLNSQGGMSEYIKYDSYSTTIYKTKYFRENEENSMTKYMILHDAYIRFSVDGIYISFREFWSW